MYKTCRRHSSFLPSAFSLASEMWGKREMDILHGPSEAQPAKQSQTGPQGFCLRKWEGGKRGAPPLPLCSKRKGLGTRLEKKAFTTRRVCLVSVQPFPSGQFTSVTYPRGTGGKHSLLRSDQMTRNELAVRNNEG